MQLSSAQLDRFESDGFLRLPSLLSGEEIAAVTAALAEVFEEDAPASVGEKRGGAVRTAMGLHLRHPVFERLVRHPRLVGPARQILGTDALCVHDCLLGVV